VCKKKKKIVKKRPIKRSKKARKPAPKRRKTKPKRLKKSVLPPVPAPARPAMPVAVRKETNVVVGNSTCPGWQRTEAGVTIKQVRVIDQREGATCGYHALKNAILIANNLAGAQTPDLCAQLNDSTRVQFLFGPSGIWRERIIAHRSENALRFEIRGVLMAHIRKRQAKLYTNLSSMGKEELSAEATKFMRLFETYQNIVNDLARAWAQQIVRDDTKITLNDQTLSTAIQSAQKFSISGALPAAYGVATREEVIALIKNPQTIGRFFDLESLKNHPLQFSRADIPAAFKAYNADMIKKRLPGMESDGDWLDDGEIEKLINDEEQKGGLLEGLQDSLMVFGDISRDPMAAIQLANIQDALTKNGRHVWGFILGTMNLAYPAGRGHWFTLVLYQHSDGTREFIVADSLNGDQLLSRQVRELVERLR